VAAPGRLEERADAFLATWQHELAATPPDAFAAAQAALVTQLLEPPRRLATEAARWWGEVERGDLQWRRPEQRAAAVARLALGDVAACLATRVLDPKLRRRVAMHVHGNNHPLAESSGVGQGIEVVSRGALVAWRASMPLYPAYVDKTEAP
jgi:secreted Zn-dependent insulinase-like peptidase